MTTLQTIKANINGKMKIVSQLYNPKTEEIVYNVNGKTLEADKFWKMKPELLGKVN